MTFFFIHKSAWGFKSKEFELWVNSMLWLSQQKKKKKRGLIKKQSQGGGLAGRPLNLRGYHAFSAPF